MEKIYYKKVLIGIRFNFFSEGTVPITGAKESLQVLSLKYKKGKYIKPHIHIFKQRKTERLSECLIVRKGKIKIELYGPDKKYFKRIFLKEGELFVLLNGGWGVHILEDAEIFEIKNGPFIKDEVEI